MRGSRLKILPEASDQSVGHRSIAELLQTQIDQNSSSLPHACASPHSSAFYIASHECAHRTARATPAHRTALLPLLHIGPPSCLSCMCTRHTLQASSAPAPETASSPLEIPAQSGASQDPPPVLGGAHISPHTHSVTVSGLPLTYTYCVR